jgi:hypothetical protein
MNELPPSGSKPSLDRAIPEERPPNNLIVPREWPNFYDRVSGQHYREFLRHLHEQLKPITYLEIGTRRVEVTPTSELTNLVHLAHRLWP